MMGLFLLGVELLRATLQLPKGRTARSSFARPLDKANGNTEQRNVILFFPL